MCARIGKRRSRGNGAKKLDAGFVEFVFSGQSFKETLGKDRH